MDPFDRPSVGYVDAVLTDSALLPPGTLLWDRIRIVCGMHVTVEAREAVYVTAFGHSWSYWSRQADGTARFLRFGRGEDLEDSIPTDIDVRINCLGTIFPVGTDNETIV